jgi:hypothetical protein
VGNGLESLYHSMGKNASPDIQQGRATKQHQWLAVYFSLNEFNVSKAVVSDLHCERGDINFI